MNEVYKRRCDTPEWPHSAASSSFETKQASNKALGHQPSTQPHHRIQLSHIPSVTTNKKIMHLTPLTLLLSLPCLLPLTLAIPLPNPNPQTHPLHLSKRADATAGCTATSDGTGDQACTSTDNGQGATNTLTGPGTSTSQGAASSSSPPPAAVVASPGPSASSVGSTAGMGMNNQMNVGGDGGGEEGEAVNGGATTTTSGGEGGFPMVPDCFSIPIPSDFSAISAAFNTRTQCFSLYNTILFAQIQGTEALPEVVKAVGVVKSKGWPMKVNCQAKKVVDKGFEEINKCISGSVFVA